MLSDESSSYIYNFNIDNCYINAMGGNKLFNIDGTVVLRGIKISNSRLRNFYIENKTLISIPSPSNIYDFAFDNNTFEEIYDNETSSLIQQDAIIIINSTSLQRNNSKLSYNINTSPSIKANGGAIVNIYGSVSSTGTKWHGGEWFTVSKTSTGVYSVTINNIENITTQGGNIGIYPVIVTPISNTPMFATVTYNTTSNFNIRLYNSSGVATDQSFHFMVSMVVR